MSTKTIIQMQRFLRTLQPDIEALASGAKPQTLLVY
jgi:hypothetical protein